MSNIVYIATSLDGYISDKNDGLGWLDMIPNPDRLDFGWTDFLNRIDAIVMGRKTFEKVCSFDCDWPYTKPVFVLSRTLKSLPEEYKGKADIIEGPLSGVLQAIKAKGYEHLYIDGGIAVQNFLKEDLIDEMIITVIPVLLGGGTPLFAELPEQIEFECMKSQVFLNALVQTRYCRKK
jgi:dihydrofolate reductase